MAADYDVSKIYESLSQSNIEALRILVDYSFENRQPEFVGQIKQMFGDDSIRAIRTHCKFALIYNEEWSIIIRTSMNLNRNGRLENLEITEDKDFCGYWRGVVDQIWEATGNSRRTSRLPELPLSPDHSIYQAVSCKPIDSTRLKELHITHERRQRNDHDRKSKK